MRIKLISPVLGVALVATGLALMTSVSSQAAPVKLYFHSAGGGYLQDWAASPDGFPADAAPTGSTLSAAAPTKTTDATAQSTSPSRFAGIPVQPSFTLPFSGDVTTMCVDLWFRVTAHAPLGEVSVSTVFNTPTETLTMEDASAPHASGAIRVTKLVKPEEVAKFTIPKDSELLVGGYMVNDADWTMLYDSVAHPSSVTLNATDCKATPIVVPSTSATPAPGGSGSPTPGTSGSATATPDPSGSATATPAPSGSATGSPTPAPTTPPPPAQETGLVYTGATSGRYSESAPVSARVTLPDGSPAPAGSVEFTLGTTRVTAPVNASGVAATRIPVLAGAGERTIVARYVANSAYLGSAVQELFTVSRMPTKCAISRTTSGSNYVVTATLRDAAGRAVVGQSVLFSFNGRNHHAVKTDRNGRASLTVAAKRGTYGISLPTNAGYAGCSASFTV